MIPDTRVQADGGGHVLLVPGVAAHAGGHLHPAAAAALGLAQEDLGRSQDVQVTLHVTLLHI